MHKARIVDNCYNAKPQLLIQKTKSFATRKVVDKICVKQQQLTSLRIWCDNKQIKKVTVYTNK